MMVSVGLDRRPGSAAQGIAKALEQAATGTAQLDLRGADLRGADLSGLTFAHVALERTCFDAANLEGTTFRHVDMTSASLRGASLIGATFRHVQAGGACFAGVQARDARWERSSLALADFTGAQLKRVRFTGCDLEESRFDDADLTLAWLVSSGADRATFRGTLLRHTETLSSTFDGAELATARELAYCRELVLEILRRHTERELEIAKMVGAVAQLRTWCYPAWAALLTQEPLHFATAIRIFAQYPRSGCLEAFIEALRTTPEPVAGSSPDRPR